MAIGKVKITVETGIEKKVYELNFWDWLKIKNKIETKTKGDKRLSPR